MHIAVCDDNIADRKQTERLLERESAARINTGGNLYVDSYGNVEALMSAPMKYDLFFIDMTGSSPDGAKTAALLREAGVTAPIVLLISKVNYRESKETPENTLFLNKPIKRDELSSMLNLAEELYKSRPQTIELRDEAKAVYILPDQFVYATPGDHQMQIKLSDGSIVSQLGSVEDLGRLLCNYDMFYLISGKIIINSDHVISIKKRTVTMSDGTIFKAGLTEGKSILRFVSARGSRFVAE